MAVSPRKPRAMLVEDEIIIALGLQQDLEELGYEVPEIAVNEAEALEKVERLRPDILLMDVNLKGPRDGIEVATELTRRFGTPVVFLTANMNRETLERAQASGSFGYLVKPYDGRELHSTLQMALARHRMFAELQRSYAWLINTLNSIGDGVILATPDGRVNFMNPAAARLVGRDPVAAWGRPVAEVLVQQATGPSAGEALAEALREGRVVAPAEVAVLVDAQGSRVLLQLQAAPVRDPGGDVSGAVLVMSDVTEKRMREQEAEKMRNLEALGRLAGGIAHDFNNLLTIIVANTSMLRYQSQAEPQLLPQLERIQHAADRAAAITSQFLTFAKGGAPLQKEVKLRPLVEAALKLSVTGSGVTTEVDIPADLWDLRVDEQQIGQVLQNLIANAREAMEAGGRLRIQAANNAQGLMPRGFTGDRDKPYVRISVQDTGVGIPEENLGKIFDPYFTTKTGATGLGLSSVHSIVQRHAGHIVVDSVVGHGTVVTVYLPAAIQAERVMRPEVEDEGPGTGRPVRVLVMDDEEMVRVSVRRMLESIGCQVETAVDGEDALSRYIAAREAERPFDAVLLDLIVPRGMGGEEAVRQLLKVDPEANPVVASGYSAHPVTSQFRTYGFKAALQKPFGLGELRRVLKSLGLSLGTRPPF